MEFLQRLTIGVALGIGLIFAFVYYFTVFDDGSAIQNQINAAQSALSLKIEKRESLKKDIEEAKKIKDRVNILSEKFKEALKFLPTEWKEDALIADISKQAQIAGVTIVKINPQKDKVKMGIYEEMGIDFEINGSFVSTMLFMSNVSRIQRIIEVVDFYLRNENPDAENPILKSTGRLMAYRYIQPDQKDNPDAKK